mgnify:CR=1 FL=1
MKGRGKGARFKETEIEAEIKSRFAWGEAVLTAIKISTTQNLSVVRWVAQMRRVAERVGDHLCLIFFLLPKEPPLRGWMG